METFKVDRLELMSELKTNKDKHLEEYQTAMIGWKERVQERLTKELERLEDVNETPKVNCLSDLPQPKSYEKDYTEAIEALDWEHEEYVHLSWQQLNNWARDEWGWTRGFTTTNAGYTQQG